MSESWQGLIMDFAANFLSLSMPTHIHDFDNHNNDYGHSKTVLMRSLANYLKSDSSTILKLGNGFGIDEDYDF
jgi:hypothetical protein